MNQKDRELELQVQSAIRLLHQRYQQLDDITDVMMEKQAKQLAYTAELRNVEQVKEDIRTIEDQSAPIRKAYIDSRKHASNVVSELTQKAGALLIRVMGKIENLERHTQEAFSKLAPQVDESVRVNQMRQAYGNGR